jgi:hypothetical protein
MNDTIVNSNLHGVIAILNERNDQIYKHKRTVNDDIIHNPNGELVQAARALLKERPVLHDFPDSWGVAACKKMLEKSYQERIAIAGALIAAEYDRTEELKKRAKERELKKFPNSHVGYYPLTPKEAFKLKNG